ncbi:uncharacterized protein HKBW3S42_01445 [Candidatus Hakubella thermalkaliphila]|nr:type II toxin-antitoxin system prevent-host-death family antitoxin [Candidatus Hakubella thermalkaliphila]MBT9171602.1 hypothetical protein [Actinomycetota bacterium]GFP19023.1 uncharacterized protein HKBW3S03_00527 [Candidatus Hakubella thermalkaliphila]GFP22046.1 uncharacterized protein HKBW3S06_01273 [Candidatus Hakubella thermalkaliphila]GFP25741.1 uncharacterized protein HKBW3S25_01222 [Candidatus Hakubella thermalkaliphila]GFP27964.1 uncharacterized protein HKBW3S33_01375 [Candidatus 
MSKIVPISEARARLTQLVKEVREGGEPIIITQRSHADAVIVNWKQYEKLMERLHILEDLERLQDSVVAERSSGLKEAIEYKSYSRKEELTERGKDLAQVVEFLRKDETIIAAYLFGSYATARENPLSDLDIAVLLDSRFPSSSYLDKQIELLTYLSQIRGTDRVDVVILNRASPLLAHRILRDGRLLFSKDESQRIYSQTRAIDLYLDMEPARRESDRQLIQRIKEGQFGYR